MSGKLAKMGIVPADDLQPAAPAAKGRRASAAGQEQPLHYQAAHLPAQPLHLPSALAAASRAAAAHPHLAHFHHPSLHNDSIVSLCPAATDTVLAMGLASRLVACTDQCALPPELGGTPVVCNLKFDARRCSAAEASARAAELRAAGETVFKLDEGLLAEEQPGVVLAPASSGAYEVEGGSVLRALERSGLLRPESGATIVCQECYSLAGVLQFALLVGQAAGVPELAGLAVERLRVRLRLLRGQTAAAGLRQPRVLVLESLSPLVAAGHWAVEVAQLAGGAPCLPLQPLDPPRRLTWDELRAAAPEVLVLSQHLQRADRAVAEVAELAAQPGWWALPAVRSGQVFCVDCALVSRPGPRLVDGAELLGAILHPHAVPRRGGAGLVLKLSLSAGQRCRHCLVPNYFVAWT
jgi:iron complex transport system substrate-binding protein